MWPGLFPSPDFDEHRIQHTAISQIGIVEVDATGGLIFLCEVIDIESFAVFENPVCSGEITVVVIAHQ